MSPHLLGVHNHAQRRTTVAAVACCATLILSGCAATDDSADTTHDPGNAAATSSEGADGQQSQQNAQGLVSGSSTEASSAQSSGDDHCKTDNLDISTSDEQGAAGSTLVNLVFKNSGRSECILEGFPGVSLVTDNNGTQLGEAAEREDKVEGKPVTLAPGASATAAVRITNAGAMDPEECKPAKADGLRVYPPNETKASFVPLQDIQGCAGDESILSVQPIATA